MTASGDPLFAGLFAQAPHARRKVPTTAVHMDERPGGRYRKIDLDALVGLGLTDRNGRPMVECRPFLSSVRVDIEAVAIDDDPAGPELHEEPYAGAHLQTHFNIGTTAYYILRDAVVHTSAGVVLVGDYLVGDTLANVNPHAYDMGVGPEPDVFRLSCRKTRRLPGRALHLLAGGGDTSYYHWLIDILARLTVPVPDDPPDVLVLPELILPFQVDSLQMLSQFRSIDHCTVGRDETLVVDELIFVPNLSGFGWAHRPESLGIFDQMRATLGDVNPRGRRIYVSRQNASARPLVNEGEVIELLSRHGYEIVELEKLDVATQARTFAEASHIVAPHGGGLANLVFAHAGAAVFELHLNHYVNWCFQRLANVRGLRYRCLVGIGEGPRNPDWPHHTRWSVDMGRLRERLAQDGFIAL